MKYTLGSAAFVAAAMVGVSAADDGFINGNHYGSAVKAITYSNWGVSGQYNKISDMSNGQCKSNKFSYGGGMAPLDGEVSWHFRGPMHLKQFAYYTLGSGTAKRTMKPSPHERRHNHQHLHKRGKEIAEHDEKRAIGDIVTATINGIVQTWANTYGGETPAPAAPAAPAPPAAANANAGNYNAPSQSSPSAASAAPKPAAAVNAGSGNWGRQAYYNAEKGQADGLVFLNNHGGAGSGVFDYTWGLSLSYASADGLTGAASPQILKDALLPDCNEFSIFTDKKCEGDSCGAVRPGTVAYHGFDGASKMFLVEFDMPLSGRSNDQMCGNADMPAIWALNAEIPRTMQYGPAECSCWTSGCGEWDIFEVLDPGNTRCKSTVHSNQSGGESDYFQRPTDKTIKAAIVFDGEHSNGHIVVLPDDTNFDTTLSGSKVQDFTGSGTNGVGGLLAKLFTLPN